MEINYLCLSKIILYMYIQDANKKIRGFFIKKSKTTNFPQNFYMSDKS